MAFGDRNTGLFGGGTGFTGSDQTGGGGFGGIRSSAPRLDVPSEISENEESARDLREALDLQRAEALGQARRLEDQTPFINTEKNRELAQRGLQTQYRRNLQGAAARGLIHSGVLNTVAAENAKAMALADVGLQADEIARRRARFLALAEESKNIRAGERQAEALDRAGLPSPQDIDPGLPNFREMEARRREVVGEQDKQAQINRILLQQSERQYSQADLEAAFRASIDEDFDQAEAGMLAAAERRGLSGDALQGLRDELARTREDAYAVATGVAEDITGPDPAKAGATLAALYEPIQSTQIKQEEGFNPAWALGAGLLGAGIGGMVGGPGGMQTGYQVGSSVGQLAQAFG